MGKMKEVFMDLIQNNYQGDYDAYCADMARITCEEFTHMDDALCIHCFNESIYRNETDIICNTCGEKHEIIKKKPELKIIVSDPGDEQEGDYLYMIIS